MVYRLAVVLILILPAACAKKHELAKCTPGPAVALNTARWTPTADQQAEMDRLVKEACK